MTLACFGAVDPFSLLNADEDAVIDSILRGMLDKKLVNDEFKSDLGFNDDKKKEPDPRMKMQLRHQQVTTFYARNFCVKLCEKLSLSLAMLLLFKFEPYRHC